MSETVRRVCSNNPAHDLRGASANANACPVCGRGLIEIATQASADLPEETGPEPIPPPLLVCGNDARHAVLIRPSGSRVCPQPECGGPLLDVECETDIRHDVSSCAQGTLICPVCNKQLLLVSCSNDPTHSLLARRAGEQACPVCGKVTQRSRLTLPKDEKKTEPPKPPSDRRWWPGIIAVVVAAICWLILVNHKVHPKVALMIVAALLIFVVGIISVLGYAMRTFGGAAGKR